MTDTIGIVRGQTQYGMGDLMVASLASMLRDRGYATLSFDGVDLEGDLARLQRADAAAILTYNGMLLGAGVGHGGSAWDDAGIPCVAWLVDHPIYHLSRLTGRSRLVLPACIDASHARFLRDWGLSNHSRELYHFAIGDPGGTPAVDRDIDVLFPASVADPEALRSEWVALPGPLLSVLEQSTAECLFRSDGDLVDIIGATCEELGIVDPEAVGVAVGYLFTQGDRYVRAQRRVDILNALADAGLVVDHVGRGDRAHPALRRHRTHGPIPASELPGWLRRARTVLHAGANFPAGSHERVFTAQRQGAVVLTESNAYWRGVFTDGEDALLFSWDDLEPVAARLKDLLHDSERLDSIGNQGRRAAEDSIVRAGEEVVAAVQASMRLRESTA